ncbi:pantetheine-phosphate adenylyltransferase [Haloechinothrix halophila]|uniref:pantetheine-phosphate adenylyltransferase n=1 Tax=Haloechinothrix halophila TaxID=1069073 RepID=UPI000552417E|nr:pantetheine-phosphate adenylyltransferase [Haloechinothrix halophila]
MRRAVCPGSYDPVTNGHLDIIERSAGLFDEVVVAVLVNKSKKGLFSIDERIELLRTVTAHLPNVRIDSWYGLLVEYCTENGIAAITKGLRAVSDFDYELQMAQMNKRLSGVDTLFMSTNPEYSFLSSSLIKEVATHGGDVTGLVPEHVRKELLRRIRENG